MFLCQICSALFASEEDEIKAKKTQKERDQEKQKQLAKPRFRCGNGRDRSERVHQPNTDSLRASKEAGCYVCTRIYERLQKGAPEDIDQRTPITLCTQQARKEGVTGQDMGYFSVTRSLPWEQCEPSTHSLQLFECIPLDEQDLVTQEQRHDDDISSSSWKLALRWLGNCLHTHTACNEAGGEAWMPSRLIDLGDKEQSNSRLIYPEADEMEGYYATVSYRWNDSLALRLLESNIDEFRRCIPDEQLPPVLKNAVNVARRFGIRYVWIDALCIIQDSRVDWEQQSSQMRKIYSMAWLNLFAAGTNDIASDRMSLGSDESGIKPIMVRIKSIWGDVDRYYLMSHIFWQDQLRNSPVSKRGWVFQERLLSRRVLHFGGNQLLWECREQSACETWPGGLPLILQERAAGNNTKRAYASWRRGELGVSLEYFGSSQSHMRIWQAITEGYSRCDITVPGDKLIALSGIAEEMSMVFQDEYLAGNWRSHFPDILMWCGGNSRPRPLRTPTWSWASVDGAIQWQGAGYGQFLIEIISIAPGLEHAKSHNTTNLTMRIRGQLFELEWKLVEKEVMLRQDPSDSWKPTKLDSPFTSLEGGVYFLPMTSPGEGLYLTRVLQDPHGLFERIGVQWQLGRRGHFHARVNLDQASPRIIDIG